MTRIGSNLALLRGCLLVLAAVFVALSASAAAPLQGGTAPGRSALAVETSAWVFPSRPLAVTVEQRGVLAGRHLAVYLFVDQNQFERITTKADRTRVVVETPLLAPGRHVLMARTGQEAAQTEFRVIPWFWLAGALGTLLLVASGGLVLAILRQRRRAARGAGSS